MMMGRWALDGGREVCQVSPRLSQCLPAASSDLLPITLGVPTGNTLYNINTCCEPAPEFRKLYHLWTEANSKDQICNFQRNARG